MIRWRIAKGKPLTPRQKRRVLRKTRRLLRKRWAKGNWVKVIDGVESYCLYGGLQKSLGLNPRTNHVAQDRIVSRCSLTETLYTAAEDLNLISHFWQEEVRFAGPGARHYRMTQALQNINDSEGQKVVLDILDRALEA